MGHYTTFIAKITLVKSIPNELVTFLENAIKPDVDVDAFDKKESFFNCERWRSLFLSTNYNDSLSGSTFCRSKDGYFLLNIQTEFKNYDFETVKFLNWISYWSAGHKRLTYLGKSKGDMLDETWVNYYKQLSSKPDNFTILINNHPTEMWMLK